MIKISLNFVAIQGVTKGFNFKQLVNFRYEGCLMLIKYKSSYEKISMGLLAYMPEEKNVKKLQQTIKKYEEDPRWQLYLWKEEDIVALVGVSLLEDDTVQLNHISVNPSYRDEGIGKKMIAALQELYKGKLVPGVQTALFFVKCDSENCD
jgi:riboflavin biosynthesis RibT protein